MLNTVLIMIFPAGFEHVIRDNTPARFVIEDYINNRRCYCFVLPKKAKIESQWVSQVSCIM